MKQSWLIIELSWFVFVGWCGGILWEHGHQPFCIAFIFIMLLAIQHQVRTKK